MKKYKYIIIGGGMTGSSAVKAIRENDEEGTIAMFSKEPFGPYNRPPLTKGLWSGKNIDDIVRPIEKFNVELFLEDEIKTVSPAEKTITDQKGEQYQYEKLLLATGGDPMPLPGAPEGVIYYRTRSDFQTLKDFTQKKDHFCVIGGGFIGSEIAAALNNQGKQVTMIFPEIGISGQLFPDDLAISLNDYYREKGVRVMNGHLVEKITKSGEKFRVQSKNVSDNSIVEDDFDAVVVGIGIKPNVKLAEAAGLTVKDGILVNEFLQTDHPDIFAAGDVANFTVEALGKRMRMEHEDNANTGGQVAGKNMTDALEKYNHLPFFYSDLFDRGYEAVGEMNKDLEIYEDWIEPFKKGTIIYHKSGKIQGLIFWNLWGKVDQGRELISQGKTFQVSDLAGLFKEE